MDLGSAWSVPCCDWRWTLQVRREDLEQEPLRESSRGEQQEGWIPHARRRHIIGSKASWSQQKLKEEA